MSRWVESFHSHQFQTTWEQILKISDEIVVDDSTVVTSVEEVLGLLRRSCLLMNYY